jgi:hypothetical protein
MSQISETQRGSHEAEDNKAIRPFQANVYQKGIAYGFQTELRPRTLYGIADSPSASRPISWITTRAATS